MHWLSGILQRITAALHTFAEHAGGPGLLVIAFLDSSFLSLPEVSDILIVFFVIKNPPAWLFYALMATIGSLAGCLALYEVARRGGERFLRKRFHERHIDRGLDWFKRYGLLAVVVPSILPPPTPFKIFVLLAGVAGVRRVTFLIAVLIGRGFRYGGEALLAYRYGDQATAFITQNLRVVSIWVGCAVAALGLGYIVWRRFRTA